MRTGCNGMCASQTSPAVLFWSFFPVFNLTAAWAINFCMGYLPFAFLLKCGVCDMPKQCKIVTVKFTCFGPTFTPLFGTRPSLRVDPSDSALHLATELGPAMVAAQGMSNLAVAVNQLDSMEMPEFEVEPPEDLIGVLSDLMA